MKKRISLLILTALCLTACGVKGPLYFPTEQDQNQQNQSQQ